MIDYHVSCTNIVADTLSQKSYGQVSSLVETYTSNFLELRKLKLGVDEALWLTFKFDMYLLIEFARLSKMTCYAKS